MNKIILAAWAAILVLFPAGVSAAEESKVDFTQCHEYLKKDNLSLLEQLDHGVPIECLQLLRGILYSNFPETEDNKELLKLQKDCKNILLHYQSRECRGFFAKVEELQKDAKPQAAPSGVGPAASNAGNGVRPNEAASAKKDDEQAAAAAKKADAVAGVKFLGEDGAKFDYLSPQSSCGVNCGFAPAAGGNAEKPASSPAGSAVRRADKNDERQHREDQEKRRRKPHVLSAKENRKLAETCARWTGEGKCLCRKGEVCSTKKAAKNPPVDGSLPRWKTANKTPDSPFGFFTSFFAGLKKLFSPAPTVGSCRLRGTNIYCARGDTNCVCR